MKNLIKAFGIALLFSGVFAATNVSAQAMAGQTSAAKTVGSAPTSPIKPTDKFEGTDPQGNNVFKGAKGKYYVNTQGIMTYEPKGTKITCPPKTK